MNGANIDIITQSNGGMRGTGDVASRLMESGFNVNALRTNDVLRKEEWQALDNKLIEVGHKRLVAIGDIVSRGMVYNIPNGLGTTILEWERVSSMTGANVSMSGTTEGEKDILDFDLQSMPLPIIHKDFSINIRKLEASRKSGQPLDTAQAEQAMRIVAETTEDMFFNGHATQVGAATIPGLLTQADIGTGTTNGDWSTDATGANFLLDILAAIAQANDDHFYGPFGIYTSQKAFHQLQNDYTTGYPKTIMSRLMEIQDLEFIRPSRDMPLDDSFVLFQLSSDVVDEVIGLQPTVVSWDSNGGMTKNFKVMSIMIPRVRSTMTGQSGIVYRAS